MEKSVQWRKTMVDWLKTSALIWRILLAVAGLVGLLALWGWAKERNAMEQNATGVTVRPAIPAIDAAAPTRIETATFALG
jgi:hypothetical protein